VGSNRQFIEEEIPHIGALSSTDLEEVVRRAAGSRHRGNVHLDEEAIYHLARISPSLICVLPAPVLAAVGVVANHQMASA